MDFQDAVAAGLGVTEYARSSRAAQEVGALWTWIHAQFEENRTSADDQSCRQAAA
jgi:hypothetical protein